MNSKKLKMFTALVVLVCFFTSQSGLNTCFAISNYNRPTINPAVVLDPLVYNYAVCVDKYKFCSCELIGKGVNIAPYDKDSDGKLSFIEMREARNSEIFTDEQMGNETFLACHYEPPSPGPYSFQDCEKMFGNNDCVCVNQHGLFYGQCYSKTIIKFSPEPISIPEVFCSHVTTGGFDNCLCDDTQQDAYLGGDIKCYVLPEAMGQDWDCETDNLRIFSGSKYTCRIKDGLVFRPDCCPGSAQCMITEYDTGLGNLSTYLSATNMALKAYMAYQGYAIANEGASVAGFVGSTLSQATSEGVTAAAEQVTAYYSAGQAANAALATMSMAMGYIAIAIIIYSYLATTFNTCKEGEYELICKASSSLCIYTGKHEVSSSKEVKVYMCYSSQIAKIVNEYGLPQIHDPDCHIDNCDAGANSSSCGCRSAYTIGGKAKNTRHKGFSPDEFERLDFNKIPISEVLIQAMMGEGGQGAEKDFAKIAPLNTPSPFLMGEVSGSMQDQVTDPGKGLTGETKYEGNCTYNIDGSVKWPIDKADFQLVDHAVGIPTATLSRICIAAPLPEQGRTFVAKMDQDMEMADRLMLPDPSTANNGPFTIKNCNDTFKAAGWPDIGDFTVGAIEKLGTFFPGSGCMDPYHIDTEFYKQQAWYQNSFFYEVMTFTKNEINARDQLVTLPEQYWFWDTIELEGETVPATHYYDLWVYWLPETDIKRGEWVSVEEKCILKDTDGAKRAACENAITSCYNGCGNNDACKNACENTFDLCIDGPLKYLSPPLSPKSLYVDVTGKPEYVSPAPDSQKYVHINATGHVDFNRPASPVYAVVNIAAHAELTRPPTPREITINTNTVSPIAIPGEYNPATGESLTEPGKYFKDNLACQSWYISNFVDKNIDAYLTNKCEAVAAGKLITDLDYNIARVKNSSICPNDYTLGVNCWNNGALLYDGTGQNTITGAYFKDDPLCQDWYQTNVAEKKLDYNLSNNCTIAPNGSPGAALVHTFSRTCPAGFMEGVDCSYIGGRAIYDAAGIGIYEGATMDHDPVCINWFNGLVATYGIQATLDKGCFLNASPKPPGINTFNTNKIQCTELPGFTLGVDCFDNGLSIYDSNGYDAVSKTYFKDEPVCKTWYQTQVTDKGILATLSNRCTLVPMGEIDSSEIFTKFDIQGNNCPNGFAEGVDCYRGGKALYDSLTGYSDRLGRYFKDDPLCMNWYSDQILDKGIQAELQNNCTLKSTIDMGKDFLPINLEICPPGTIEGTNCFCDCPTLAEDIFNDKMICPRPSRKNIIQRLSIHNSISSAFNTYYGRPDVQTRYELYLP